MVVPRWIGYRVTIVDLFAGAGGWDVAARDIGIATIGLELDRDACATRARIGLRTIRADLHDYGPQSCGGLIASPPCPTFSVAGSGAGRDAIPEILVTLDALAAGQEPDHLIDSVSALVLVPFRWAFAVRPRWIVLEQVPPVLPIWERYAHHLRALGYSVWCGVLNAADFGVPQTRRRAILIASADRAVGPPPPTHAQEPVQGLFGTLRPWVSMSEALSWSGAALSFPRGDGMTKRYGARPDHPMDRPAPTMREKSRCATWRVVTGETTTTRYQPRQVTGPATPITAADNTYIFDGTTKARRLTLEEGLVLQGFPPDLPLVGSRTSRWRQLGNAVPPPLARAVLLQVFTENNHHQ
jgi:DNA (cytosine-5)-methyltransferase 1